MIRKFGINDLLASILLFACALALLQICAGFPSGLHLLMGMAGVLFFTGASFGALFRTPLNFGLFFLLLAGLGYFFFARILESFVVSAA